MFDVDRRDDLGLACPEPDRGAIGGEQLRERGAPGAATDHAEALI